MGIIRHSVSGSALCDNVSILSYFLTGILHIIKGKRCLVTFGRIDGHAGRIRQLSAIRAGHCEGKFIPWLELTAGDDFLAFHFCCGRLCFISVLKGQMISIIIHYISTQCSI